jgi:hypothetical protein
MRRIQKVAPKNLSPTIAKPLARKKYDFRVEEVPPQAGPELSAGDRKVLARLIRKYGGEAVVAAATVLPPGRAPGRPSRGLLPYYERMHLTEWIEEQAEEYRQKGNTAPYKDAERDMYQMRYGSNEPRKGRTIKKLRQQGRRDWIELLEKMLNHCLYKGQQDFREKLQHYKKHARVVR